MNGPPRPRILAVVRSPATTTISLAVAALRRVTFSVEPTVPIQALGIPACFDAVIST